MQGVVSTAAAAAGISGPDRGIKPSSSPGAHCKQPGGGGLLLPGKTERSLAFESADVESESTWTRERHQSEKSCLNLNKTRLAQAASGYKLDSHKLEIKFLVDGKPGRSSQQMRRKAHVKRVLETHLNSLPKKEGSEECGDVASAEPADCGTVGSDEILSALCRCRAHLPTSHPKMKAEKKITQKMKIKPCPPLPSRGFCGLPQFAPN